MAERKGPFSARGPAARRDGEPAARWGGETEVRRAEEAAERQGEAAVRAQARPIALVTAISIMTRSGLGVGVRP